jgi:hypothetical protein
MSITYELLEEFTGTRTTEMPDPDNEGETVSTETDCRDVQVRFTCSDTDCVHERSVNVCFDADGAYDHNNTLVRIGEVGNGVAHKIACGVISATT